MLLPVALQWSPLPAACPLPENEPPLGVQFILRQSHDLFDVLLPPNEGSARPQERLLLSTRSKAQHRSKDIAKRTAQE